MPRQYVNNYSINPYHITGRCHSKEHFPLPQDIIWHEFENLLYSMSFSFQTQIHAFVLMPNHFHLLMTTPNLNLSESMQYFMRESTRSINNLSAGMNQLWGGRFFRSEINSSHYLNCVYKYLYRNPVRAQISKNVESYPYSTLYGLLGREQLVIPTFDEAITNSPADTLKWLNETPPPKYEEYVRIGLKKKIFKLPKVDSRPNPLEIDML